MIDRIDKTARVFDLNMCWLLLQNWFSWQLKPGQSRPETCLTYPTLLVSEL